jgi:large subunit ribosomal protein L1
MATLTKRQQKMQELVEEGRKYTIEEAAELVKKAATAKFDETIEVAFRLGVDPRHADQMVRGSVSLPHGTGKTVRVVVFCKQEDQQAAAREAGADEVGAEDLVEKVQGGWTEFDAAVAAPDMMSLVGRLGKVLGPRGLMPSPKAGSVTPNVGEAVADIKRGKIDYRVDKLANIHAPIAKASFTAEQIADNAAAIIEAVVKARPAACKGTYMRGCAMSSTMSPGFKLDTAALTARFRKQ